MVCMKVKMKQWVMSVEWVFMVFTRAIITNACFLLMMTILESISFSLPKFELVPLLSICPFVCNKPQYIVNNTTSTLWRRRFCEKFLTLTLTHSQTWHSTHSKFVCLCSVHVLDGSRFAWDNATCNTRCVAVFYFSCWLRNKPLSFAGVNWDAGGEWVNVCLLLMDLSLVSA